MTAERKAGLHSHLRRTHRGHRTCLLQKLRRQLGGGGGRACEVSWSHKAGRTRGDQGSTETIWRNRPVGVRKNTASTVFFLLLPRVWWVSALIYNQGHQGEELQNKDKEVEHDDRSEAWGREQRKVKRERNILCRSIRFVICKTTAWNNRKKSESKKGSGTSGRERRLWRASLGSCTSKGMRTAVQPGLCDGSH